jgi:TolB protein
MKAVFRRVAILAAGMLTIIVLVRAGLPPASAQGNKQETRQENKRDYAAPAKASAAPTRADATVKSNAAPQKPGSDTIVYSTFRPGNWDVYYFAKRGSAPKRLTDDPGLDYDSVFSPDGRWIIFCSERRGSPDLYALDLQNPGSPRLLVEDEGMEDQAVISPDGRTMAFVSDRDGSADIYLIPFKPEKTQSMKNASKLTSHAGGEFRPAFSPDAKSIAFSADWDVSPTGPAAQRSREGEIYLMNSDGRNLRRLTTSPGWDGSPVWSPDGRTIYFYAKRGDKFRVWAMNADGTHPRAVSPAGLASALSPTLSPEGRVIFAANLGSMDVPNWKILSVAPDGTDQRTESDEASDYWNPAIHAKTGAMVCHGPGPLQKDLPAGEPGLTEGPLLTPNSPAYVRLPDRTLAVYPVRNFAVTVAPAGRKIATTDSFYNSHYLAVSNLDGTEQKIIYERKDQKKTPPLYVPSWSKDGQWIAWMGGLPFGPPTENADIWKMRTDGTGAVNLTPNTPGNDGFPDFSGDGNWIVFRSGRAGNFDIFLMKSDGTGVTNLTNHPAYDAFPSFSPVDREVAFASNRDGVLDEKARLKTFEIYTLKIKPDGTAGELRRITNSAGQDSHPRYSPDGRWLVFASEQGGINDEEPLIQEVFFSPQSYGEIYAVRLKDLKTVRVTHNKWEDGTPSWGAAFKR